MIYTDLDNYQSICPHSPNPYTFLEQNQFNEIVNDNNLFSILNENENISKNPNEEMKFNSPYFLEKQSTKWKTKNDSLFWTQQDWNNVNESGFNCVLFDKIKENFKNIENLSGFWEKLKKNKKIEDAEKKIM